MFKAQTPKKLVVQDSGLLVAGDDCVIWQSAGGEQ